MRNSQPLLGNPGALLGSGYQFSPLFRIPLAYFLLAVRLPTLYRFRWHLSRGIPCLLHCLRKQLSQKCPQWGNAGPYGGNRWPFTGSPQMGFPVFPHLRVGGCKENPPVVRKAVKGKLACKATFSTAFRTPFRACGCFHWA